ncbi:MAG: hypothetical protein Alpg2KO_21880 [Alphaproteobacteria bacterium]
MICLTITDQGEVIGSQQLKSGYLIAPFRDITSMDPQADGSTKIGISELVEHNRRDIAINRLVVVSESIPEIFEQAGFPVPASIRKMLEEKFPKHLEDKPAAAPAP